VSDSTYGAGAIEDASVYSLKPNMNAGTWTYNHAGYYDSTYGVARTAVRLTGLLADSGYAAASMQDIQSAVFYLTEANWTNYATVNLYALNSNATWTESGVTWNNIGTYSGTLYSTAQMGYGETEAFDITSLLKAWKNGMFSGGQCGFILVNTNETTVDKTLYSSEHGTTAYRPYVAVTYTLDGGAVELDENATTTLSSAGITGTITWASSNTAVATVSNGVVTGRKAGLAVITASVNGVVQKSFTVRVTLKDGEYCLSSGDITPYLSVETISYANNTQLKLHHLADEQSLDRMRQHWNIRYMGDGYYTIATMYNDNLRIRATSNSTVALYQNSDIYSLWMIEWSGNAYKIYNKGYTGYVLSKDSDDVADQHSTKLTNNSSHQWTNWQIAATVGETEEGVKHLKGLLLLNSQTGTRADYDTHTAKVFNPPTSGNQVVTMSSLGLEVKVFDNTNSSQAVVWSSDNTAVASVDMTTGTLTIKAAGGAVIKAIRAIGGVLYETTYKVSVIRETINADIRYDDAYIETYPNAVSRLNGYASEIQRIYAFYLEKNISFSSPQIYTSYAAKCPRIAANERCICGLCQDGDVDRDGFADEDGIYEHTHSHLLDNYYDIPEPEDGKRIAFIGYDTCSYTSTGHYFNSEGSTRIVGYGGACRACVATATATSMTEKDELMYAVHEFGHMLGAPDHYGTNGRTTDIINEEKKTVLFKYDCIYGENKDEANVRDNLIVCEGCQQEMRKNS